MSGNVVERDHIMAALIGSAGSGMTTLIEAVLHRAGAIPRPGTIAGGNTVGDYSPEEIARQTTLTPSLTYLDWTTDDGVHHAVTLADTPGHPDFIGGVDAALSAADLAVVVVSAQAGVTAGTRAAWAAADAAGKPRIVMVTCADRPQADFSRVLLQLRDAFGSQIFPITLPIGHEAEFRAVDDLLNRRAYELKDGKQTEIDRPADMVAESDTAHDQMTEEIVQNDDEMMEAYLEGHQPTPDQLEKKLGELVSENEAYPVIVASGVTETGVDRFVDLICRLTPALADKSTEILMDGTPVEIAPDPAGDPILSVFQTVADPFLGQISMFKVLSGTVKGGDKLRNATTGTEERLNQLFRLRGAEHLPVDSLSAGDVGAVAKLQGTPSGSLLWNRKQGNATPLPVPERRPTYSVVLEPATTADTEKLSTQIQRVVAEDPTLVIEHVAGKTILRGLGDAHIGVAVDRLKRVGNVSVNTSPAPVAYHETIAKNADVEGKLKKQSGGSGQFAVVQTRVSPNEPGGGFKFVDSVVGGSVPRNFIPAVEKGAREATEQGGPNGFPIVDIIVELYDGKAHSVDSNENAFRTAGRLAVQNAMTTAGSVILEPIDIATVTVPLEHQGAVMTDLSGRRGARVITTETAPNGDAVIIANVPEAELARYVLDLRQMTQGHASLSIAPDRYERYNGPPLKKEE
ncbi:MAG: elongation factor G [Promicromonosporaceae bacterium]|nr:elongation factor G [Promicromonosporaceae bacterium]